LYDDRKVTMSGIRTKVATIGATVVMGGAVLIGTAGTAAAATPSVAPTVGTATTSATQFAPEWRRCTWRHHHLRCWGWGGGWGRWHHGGGRWGHHSHW
jgi:hypothetical protein